MYGARDVRSLIVDVDPARAFAGDLRSQAREVLSRLPAAAHRAVGSATSTQAHEWPDITVMGELVTLPYRIYNPVLSPSLWGAMSGLEQMMVACLYTRHHDGFVRQAYLRTVLASAEPWIVPFVVQLCGEYVIEICADIEHFASDVLPANAVLRHIYTAFLSQNATFLALTEHRATSYWSCYPRRQYPIQGRYPGLSALTKLRAISTQGMTPRLVDAGRPRHDREPDAR